MESPVPKKKRLPSSNSLLNYFKIISPGPSRSPAKEDQLKNDVCASNENQNNRTCQDSSDSVDHSSISHSGSKMEEELTSGVNEDEKSDEPDDENKVVESEVKSEIGSSTKSDSNSSATDQFDSKDNLTKNCDSKSSSDVNSDSDQSVGENSSSEAGQNSDADDSPVENSDSGDDSPAKNSDANNFPVKNRDVNNYPTKNSDSEDDSPAENSDSEDNSACENSDAHGSPVENSNSEDNFPAENSDANNSADENSDADDSPVENADSDHNSPGENSDANNSPANSSNANDSSAEKLNSTDSPVKNSNLSDKETVSGDEENENRETSNPHASGKDSASPVSEDEVEQPETTSSQKENTTVSPMNVPKTRGRKAIGEEPMEVVQPEVKRRRSSRLESKRSLLMIQLPNVSPEEASTPRRRRKETVEVKISRNSVVKTPLKVAPLFLLSKQKRNLKSPGKRGLKVVDSESDEEPLVVTSVEMTPERAAFLKSGVPEFLKVKPTVECETFLPSFELNVHVHNLSDSEIAWLRNSLPENSNPKWLLPFQLDPFVASSLNFRLDSREIAETEELHSFKTVMVSDEETDSYLEKISKAVPQFPAKKYFKCLLGCKGRAKQNTQNDGATKIEADVELRTWADKYGGCIAAILGAKSAILNLKRWLLEWKRKTSVEESEKNKNKKTTNEKKSETVTADSDDDFQVERRRKPSLSSDEEEGEKRLPVSYVIVGPHGVGKTALVYSLADKLGYKVFEVSASSRRTGKQIVQQLQEAMKSQHVAKDQLSNLFSTFQMMRDKQTAVEQAVTASRKRKADAVLNFFQPRKKARVEDNSSRSPKTALKETQKPGLKGTAKTATVDTEKASVKEIPKTPSEKTAKAVSKRISKTAVKETPKAASKATLKTSTKETEKTPVEESPKTAKDSRRHRNTKMIEEDSPVSRRRGRRKKEMEKEEVAPQVVSEAAETSKGLTLASCSLILFDEADVVFDEDRGFWSAVHTFVETNKRPILLTCSDMNVLEHCAPDTAVCRLHLPSTELLAAFLSTVCLAEGFFLAPSSLKLLVRSFDNDPRRCLTWLHWQLTSTQQLHPPRYDKALTSQESHSDLNLSPLLARLPSRPRSVKLAEPSETQEEKKSLDCSLLGVFSTEAEEKIPLPPRPSAMEWPEIYANVQDADWPVLEAWSRRCLQQICVLTELRSRTESLLPAPPPPGLRDSCEDAPRYGTDGLSSTEITEAVQETLHRVLSIPGDLKTVSEEMEMSDVLRRLPEGLSQPEVSLISGEAFAAVQSSVLRQLPQCLHLQQRSLTLDYLPQLTRMAKTEQTKRLNSSKRRFLHYFDRIGFDLPASAVDRLCTDFA